MSGVAGISRRHALLGAMASLPVLGMGGCVSSPVRGSGSGAESIATLSDFGFLDDSQPVRLARLTHAGGLSLEVSELGATVTSIRLGPAMRSVVLGYDSFKGYAEDARYVCSLVGRVANRIANGTFMIDGQTYQVTRNRDGDCLHGGLSGFNRKLWVIEDIRSLPYPSVTMSYVSAHLEEGFPGELTSSVRFSLPASDIVRIEIFAHTDRPTPVNLTHHFYFNLGLGSEDDILDHRLMIAGSEYTPITMGAIPTGEIASVQDTPFDLRTGRTIAEVINARHPQIEAGRGINHNWVIDRGAPFALSLESPRSGIRMMLRTNQPGLQINSGHRLGGPFQKYSGLVVEPQNFPDSVNQPAFPNSVLRPGETYFSTYDLQFETGA